MSEYTPPIFPRGTIFNTNDFLYTFDPLKYITNIGVGSKVYKQTVNGIAQLRTVLSNAMIITQNANEIDIASTGKFYGVPGTNAAPTYSFQGDTDTGIHRPSANNLHLVSGGSDIIRCSDTLGVVLPSGLSCLNSGRYLSSQIGSASNPTYQYYDGTLNDSGLFFKTSTWEPSISHKSNLVAEFGSNNFTLYKTLSSGVQPYSSYLRNTDQSLTGGASNTILYDTKEQEYSSRITFASGVYTVLDAGVYHIHADLQISAASNFDISSFFTINNSGTDRVGYIVTRTMTVHLMSISNVIRLSANDTVRVQVIPAIASTLNTTANGTRKLRFSIVRLF